MADSTLLLDSLLNQLDDPSISGKELLQSLDKNESLLSLQGTDVALQMLDVAAVDGLFSAAGDSSHCNRDHHIDSDANSESAASITTSSPPLAVADNIRSRDAIRRSAYRQKQKEQKDALYRQVEELSSQLERLQKRKESGRTSHGPGLGHGAVWKALAGRHMQARVVAEEQRRRLCKAVERRSALIRDLGTLIRKRISEEQPEEAVHAAKKPRTESPDVVLYEAFISELDDVYAKTDSIFKEAALETAVGAEGDSCDDVQVFFNPSQKAKPDARSHELVGVFTTPFAFERVRAFLYKVCNFENQPGYEVIEGSWIPDHTDIAKTRIVGPGGNSLVQHTIMRRYREADRIVFVWRKFTEGEGAFAGMHADETGWAIVRPSPSSSVGSPSTVMESVIRFVPINFSTAPASTTVMKQFTDTLVKTGEDICQASFKILEELLLDDSLGVC
ncbi:uncharacterized protein IUM83_01335 [Phytophthora cinnamomi]|uniref:uncharacterized protein n=1 Tax=Phytophthora cinnamomi TaxID=4785 RepID=UPI00355A593B|nr:hypothetical protein IUM83_01335 [Phytophthora cinnamomi]